MKKMIYVVMGRLDCSINGEEVILHGGDSISFDSTKEHFFKNSSNVKCKFIAVENPGRY
jgi:uncharacterized cupin superfamily protein